MDIDELRYKAASQLLLQNVLLLGDCAGLVLQMELDRHVALNLWEMELQIIKEARLDRALTPLNPRLMMMVVVMI